MYLYIIKANPRVYIMNQKFSFALGASALSEYGKKYLIPDQVYNNPSIFLGISFPAMFFYCFPKKPTFFRSRLSRVRISYFNSEKIVLSTNLKPRQISIFEFGKKEE